jgi:hypothetical protein
MPAGNATPVPLLVSCAFGALGLACILVGAVVGVEGLFVAGAALGALSLGAALYWRSELISEWRRDRPGGRAR